MKSQARNIIIALTLLGDLMAINLLIRHFWLADARLVLGGIWPLALLLSSLCWIILAWLFRLNPLPRIKERKKLLRNTIGAGFILIFLTLLAHISINRNITLSPDFLYFSTGLLAVLSIWNLLMDSLMSFLRSRGIDNNHAIIAGYDEHADSLREFFEKNPWTGYRFTGFVDEKEGKHAAMALNELRALAENGKVDTLFLNLSCLSDEDRARLKGIAIDHHIRITLIPDMDRFLAYHHRYERFDLMPLISIGQGPLSLGVNRFIKRNFDILFSLLTLLAFFSWFSLLAAMLIRLSSPGPVFFRQRRTGYHNRPFTILKFRTMEVNQQADQLQAQKDDPRLTRIGRFLRKTNLDELPQLLNVLTGHMSVVGPRPHMLEHTEQYSGLVPQYLSRHYIRPGMTGLAQVRGLRGATPAVSDMKARIAEDVYYIENWSFWLDIKIIWLTLLRMIKGDAKAY